MRGFLRHETFDPRKHVFIDKDNILYSLKNSNEVTSRLRRIKKAKGKPLTHEILEDIKKIKHSSDYAQLVNRSAIIFVYTNSISQASIIAKNIELLQSHDVTKTLRDIEELEHVASHVRKKGGNAYDEMSQAGEDRRDADKIKREIAYKEKIAKTRFQNLARQGLSGMSTLASEQRWVAQELERLKAKARTYDDKADFLERGFLTDVKKAMGGISSEKYKDRSFVADLENRAKKRIENLKATTSAFSNIIDKSNRLASRLERALYKYECKWDSIYSGTNGMSFKGYLHSTDERIIAQDLNISIREVTGLKNSTAQGDRVAELRKTADVLTLQAYREAQTQMRWARIDVQHQGMIRSLSTGGSNEYNQKRIDNAAYRLYRRLSIPIPGMMGNKKIWDFIGVSLHSNGIMTFGPFMRNTFTIGSVAQIYSIGQDIYKEKEALAWERGAPFVDTRKSGAVSKIDQGLVHSRKASGSPTYSSSISNGILRFNSTSPVGRVPSIDTTYTRYRTIKGIESRYKYLGTPERGLVFHQEEYQPGKFRSEGQWQYRHPMASGVGTPILKNVRASEFIIRKPARLILPQNLGMYDTKGSIDSTIWGIRDWRDNTPKEKQPNSDLYKKENGRSYSGYGPGNAQEHKLDMAADFDWHRRQMFSLPSSVWSFQDAARYIPGWKPTGTSWFSFGETPDKEMDEGFRTLKDVQEAGAIKSIFTNRSKGNPEGKKLEITTEAGASYQVLPDQRVRQIIQTPWKTISKTLFQVGNATSVEKLAEIAKKVLHYGHPEGVDRILKYKGLDEAFVPGLSMDEFHPAWQSVIQEIKNKFQIISSSEQGQEFNIAEETTPENAISRLIRSTDIKAHEQVAKYNDLVDEIGPQAIKKQGIKAPGEESFAVEGSRSPTFERLTQSVINRESRRRLRD